MSLPIPKFQQGVSHNNWKWKLDRKQQYIFLFVITRRCGKFSVDEFPNVDNTEFIDDASFELVQPNRIHVRVTKRYMSGANKTYLYPIIDVLADELNLEYWQDEFEVYSGIHLEKFDES